MMDLTSSGFDFMESTRMLPPPSSSSPSPPESSCSWLRLKRAAVLVESLRRLSLLRGEGLGLEGLDSTGLSWLGSPSSADRPAMLTSRVELAFCGSGVLWERGQFVRV